MLQNSNGETSYNHTNLGSTAKRACMRKRSHAEVALTLLASVRWLSGLN